MKKILGIALMALLPATAVVFYLNKRTSQPTSEVLQSPGESKQDNSSSEATPSPVNSSTFAVSAKPNESMPAANISDEIKAPILQLLLKQDLSALTESQLTDYFKSQGISANEESQIIAENERRKVWSGFLANASANRIEVKMRNQGGGEALRFESAALIIPNTPETAQESESLLKENFPSQPVEEKDYGNVKIWKFANGQRVWIEKEKSATGDEETLRIATEFSQE